MKQLDATTLKNMLLCASESLNKNVDIVNELNVFPVPDGDTGTNMAMTMQEAADELRKNDFDSVDQVTKCVANATLRGARGNSGVITSLLFRGISKKLKGLTEASPADFAQALIEGVDAAYKAVMKPAEGTILSVSKASAKAAKLVAEFGGTLDKVLESAVSKGTKALEQTTEINPVLKKAGVVDAGGKGFIIILEAMLASLKGEMLPEADAERITDSNKPFDKFETDEITFAYDTVFIVRKETENIDLSMFESYLNSIGDSIVIGESDESFKVHVHTDVPGNVLTESMKYGTLELCKIENMKMQHDDLVAGKKARSTDDLEDEKKNAAEVAAPEKEFGCVAICAGEGIENLFREVGIDGLVTGGQTMNPSTADILKEVNKVPANTVFVLPNNKNIIMAAQQCAPLTEKKVVVVPTTTIPQGISAMLSFDPSMEADEIEKTMAESLENVHTAQITYAARNSDFDGHNIHAGEYLALLDGKLLGNFKDKNELFKVLSSAVKELNANTVTLYYGTDVSEEQAEESASMVEENLPDADVSVIYGGQPVYYFIVSIEC